MLLSAEQTDQVLDLIEILYPKAQPELNFDNDFQLLIAVILSAQTTDISVNKITPKLFEDYPTPEAMSQASPKELEPYLHSIGLYRNKARFIQSASQQLVENFDGQVPSTRKELESLSGVGRKTANVVLSVAFETPAIAVDTHVERVSKRLKMVPEDATVRQVEAELEKKIPKERWSKAHHLLIFFGRYACPARQEGCGEDRLLAACQDDQLKEELKRIWQISSEDESK